MDKRLEGKVAVITGSGGSIGRAACLAFCASGAKVVGSDINSETARATLDLVEAAGGEMISVDPCDLAEAIQAERLIAKAVDTYGHIDILYNNGAMAYFDWFADMSFDTFSQTMRDELDIVFQVTKAAWPYLIENGSGSVINTGSVSGMICYRVVPGLAHSAAKAGVIGMTRHLAMEGAPHNIRANTLSPGLIETNQTQAFMEDKDWWEPMREKIMLGRIGKPAEVALAAVFLASDDSSFVTGANIPVDGGTTAW
tara:strand:+ start:41192 stop:41956 length:765 start_codon:yes stop_codon:yes gene_type:complete